jgi:hypothetical protein
VEVDQPVRAGAALSSGPLGVPGAGEPLVPRGTTGVNLQQGEVLDIGVGLVVELE